MSLLRGKILEVFVCKEVYLKLEEIPSLYRGPFSSLE